MGFYLVTGTSPDGDNLDLFIRAESPGAAIQMLYDYWNQQGIYVEGEIFTHEVPPLPAADGVVLWGSIATSWCDSAKQCTWEECDDLSEDEDGSVWAAIQARRQPLMEGADHG